MDDIEKRLRETADACISSYAEWHKDKKNGSARETLMEAIHELRKVASRVEIEMAVSERDEMTQRPIPVPPHRDATRRTPQEHEDFAPGNQLDDEGSGNNHRPQQNQQNNNNHHRRRHHHQRRQGGHQGGQ